MKSFYILLIDTIIFNFIMSFLSIKFFKRYLGKIGLKGRDINKRDHIIVEESFGIPIFFSMLVSLFILSIFSKTFSIYKVNISDTLIYLLGSAIIVYIGFLEDLTSLQKKGYKKDGIKQQYKPIIPILASLPIIYLTLNRKYIYLPFFGRLHIGLIYPLILVPIGIIGASNATNMLAGLNGLEASLGSITILTLSIYAWIHSRYTTSIIGILFVVSLISFLYYNWYPAKIFPGDSLNYYIGFTIGSIAIIGNIEWFSLSIFIIWFIELFLKLRSKFKAESFGKITKEGKLIRPYNKIYSLTHLFMNGKLDEKSIVIRLDILQAVICIVMLILYTM